MIVVGRVVFKLIDAADRRAASISSFSELLLCGVSRRPSGAALAVEGGLSTVAVDVHLEDCCVMDEAVDGGEGHGLIGEDLAPLSERLVCGDQHGSPFVSGGNQLEENAGLGMVLGDICDVVEDQQVVVVELGDGAFQRQLAACLLHFFSSRRRHTKSLCDWSSDVCSSD